MIADKDDIDKRIRFNKTIFVPESVINTEPLK